MSIALQGCLTVATLSLLMVMPLSASAQDEAQTLESLAPAEPLPALRRLFVSDKLVLNVYSEPDQAGSRVATIETGEAVDELERDQGFVHVRLEDGREGWVSANYLTSEAPAAVQLRELQRQQKSAVQAAEKKSADEIARLKRENEALQAQVKELKAAAAAPTVVNEGVLEGAAPPAQDLASAAAPAAGGTAWIWSLVLVVAAALAYTAGYQTLAQRIRRKFGGLRIY